MAVSPVERSVRGAAAVVVTVALLMLVGCGGSTHPIEPTSTGDVGLRAYVDPPSQPPDALLGGTSLARASALWRVDGTMVSYAPDDATKVAVNDVARPIGNVVVNIDSPVLPMQGEVRAFSELTDQGFPVSDVPTEVSTCVPDKQRQNDTQCWISSAGNSVSVHITPGAFLGVTVLELYYATQTEKDMAEGVNHYAVSWAFRTK